MSMVMDDFAFLDTWSSPGVTPEIILADINRIMAVMADAQGDSVQSSAPAAPVGAPLPLWVRLELRDRFPWWRPYLCETAPTVAAWLLRPGGN